MSQQASVNYYDQMYAAIPFLSASSNAAQSGPSEQQRYQESQQREEQFSRALTELIIEEAICRVELVRSENQGSPNEMFVISQHWIEYKNKARQTATPNHLDHSETYSESASDPHPSTDRSPYVPHLALSHNCGLSSDDTAAASSSQQNSARTLSFWEAINVDPCVRFTPRRTDTSVLTAADSVTDEVGDSDVYGVTFTRSTPRLPR